MRKAMLFGVIAVLLTMTQPARAQFCPGVSPWVFDDVQASDPFCGFITWMAQNGITLGCQVIDANHRLYCPNANVSRAAMAAFMNRLGNVRVEAVGTGPGLTGGPITGIGTINLATTQLLPTTACAAGQVPLWTGTAWACGTQSGGTVTSVASGTGLAGGPITASGTLSIAATYRLPQSCTAAQVAQWNGSGWVCASVGGGGTVTSVASGTGLAGGPITTSGTLSIAAAYQLPQSCANGQVPKSNGLGAWTCGADIGGAGTVTSVATGAGLSGGPITTSGTITLAATQLLPTVACTSGQVPQWNGSAWTCATPPGAGANISLLNSTSASVGNIVKPGGVFLHNFGTNGTFLGVVAGNFTMTGINNTALGYTALNANASGFENTAVGSVALPLNSSGFQNTAVGYVSLANNTSGSFNTAVGRGALAFTNADANTGLGVNALNLNQTGVDNTAVGAFALDKNITANANTAVGAGTLFENVDGANNTAVGAYALAVNTSGEANAALGTSALNQNTIGVGNVAAGSGAAFSNISGSDNVAVGGSALSDNQVSSGNTAIGARALQHATGSNNIAIGADAGSNLTSGTFNIHIQHAGNAGESQTTRIGIAQTRFFAAGIRGVTTGVNNAINVVIDSNGQLGTLSSSREVKDDIADIGEASEVLLRLHPVSFRYKAHEGAGPVQYGLIAEEVAEVAPGLVATGSNGEVETVLYQHLPPMLLNEYQKQQRTIDAQARRIDAQQAEIVELKRAVEVLLARTSPEGRFAAR